MTEAGDGEGFLRRWSRRKLEQEVEEAPAAEVAVPDTSAATEPAADAGVDDVVDDLPDIDSLDKDSDYTAFLRDGVPEELRTLALRKLWLSDPVLANLDGLNDYDDDFSTILKTGAEYMKRLTDAGEKLTRPGDDGEEPVEGPEDESPAEVAEQDGSESTADRDDDESDPEEKSPGGSASA